MSENKNGFIEFNALLILFFVAAAIGAIAGFASASFNYFQAGSRDFEKNMEALLLLDGVIEKMQDLRFYAFDDLNSPLILSMQDEYARYHLTITDVSSGFNLNFISDADLADNAIRSLLFLDSTGSNFISWRNANGLTADKENFRPFIKEDAFKHCVSYGYLHVTDTGSFAYGYLTRIHNANADSLFPLVNNFPRMNVNMVEPEILRSFVLRREFNIERAAQKAGELVSRLKNESLTHGEIASIMSVTVNHPLMGYLGTKTAFWKLEFQTPHITAQAVVAAVPAKHGAVQDIEKYVLVDRRFD